MSDNKDIQRQWTELPHLANQPNGRTRKQAQLRLSLYMLILHFIDCSGFCQLLAGATWANILNQPKRAVIEMEAKGRGHTQN